MYTIDTYVRADTDTATTERAAKALEAMGYLFQMLSVYLCFVWLMIVVYYLK